MCKNLSTEAGVGCAFPVLAPAVYDVTRARAEGAARMGGRFGGGDGGTLVCRLRGIASKIRKRERNRSSVEFTEILSLVIDVATKGRPFPLAVAGGV